MRYFDDDAIAGDWQHEYMAAERLDDLTSALEQVCGDQYNSEQYRLLAWSGLHNTSIFDTQSGMSLDQFATDIASFQNNCSKTCE